MARSRVVGTLTSAAAKPDPVRWFSWLLAGIAAGLLIGFAMGLTKPRVKD